MNAGPQPPLLNGRPLALGLASQRILQLHAGLAPRTELLSRPMDQHQALDPYTFFNEIKENGLEVVADLHVVHRIHQELFSSTPGETIHHINISAVTLIDPRFRQTITALRQHKNWRPERICWEITELEPTPDICALVDISHWLLDQGFHVALDDYEPGNPYEPLLKYPLPWLVKLDKSLHKHPYLMDQVIEMLHQRQLRVVVEGIENVDQMEFCIQRGVDYVQGFYIERPKQLNLHSSKDGLITEKPGPKGEES